MTAFWDRTLNDTNGIESHDPTRAHLWRRLEALASCTATGLSSHLSSGIRQLSSAIRHLPSGICHPRHVAWPACRHVGQYLPDQARELESVAAARTGNDHVGAAGKEIHEEMLIGCHGVEAGLGQIDRRAGQGGDVVAQKAADDLTVRVGHDAIL